MALHISCDEFQDVVEKVNLFIVRTKGFFHT